VRLKARLKRLAADVQWLKYDGALNVIEKQIRFMETMDALDAARQRQAEAAKLPKKAVVRPTAREAPPPKPTPGPTPPPTPPPTAPPSPPAPMPGQPTSLPSADSEIRPVTWRPRTAQDYAEDDRPGTNGRCITEYDVLRDYGDDYDDDN
jgi:hypothetical protein